MLYHLVIATSLVLAATDNTVQSPLQKKSQHGDYIHIDSRISGDERRMKSRIIGGNPASVGEYPSFGFTGACGATLIHEDLMLSNGRCNAKKGSIVHIGNVKRGFGEKNKIVKISRHPDFKIEVFKDPFTFNFYNDIMIFKLKNASALPIQQLNQDAIFPPSKATATIIGFGLTNVRNRTSVSNILLEADIQIIPTSDCSTYFRNLSEVQQICAGLPADGKDTCIEDEGGPLYVKSVNETLVQVGIVSLGSCGNPEKNGIYTRVSNYQAWISEQICELSSYPPAPCPKKPDKKPKQCPCKSLQLICRLINRC